MPICRVCKKEKPITEFNKSKHHLTGFNTFCRECQRITNRQYYTTKAEVDKKKSVEKQNKLAEHRNGISPDNDIYEHNVFI